MASRQCLSSLPTWLEELPQVPRRGPVSRGGYEPDASAAGYLFPVGEYDSRVPPTADAHRSGKRMCTAPALAGAAVRFRSPQPEPRVVDIDINHGRRRAASCPPCEQTRTAIASAIQAFGVLQDIDGGLSSKRRCQSPRVPTEAKPEGRRLCLSPPPAATRQESARRALCSGNIDGVMRKKHFTSPTRSPSPPSKTPAKTPAKTPKTVGRTPQSSKSCGILPLDSPSYSMTCPAKLLASPRLSPRGRSSEYFGEALAAENYAKLIGRPTIAGDKGFRRMNLAKELDRREKFDPAWIHDVETSSRIGGGGGKESLPSTATVSTTASGCSTPSYHSVQQAAPATAIAAKLQALEISSIAESNALPEEKAEAIRNELQDQKLSALHKLAVAEGADEEELAEVIDAESQRDAYIELILAKAEEKAQSQCGPMPLALKRVVASILPSRESMTENFSQDLKAAVQRSAQTIHLSQGSRANRKPSLCLSPRRLNGML